jgi:broad specificity phosphatase PhoE
MPLMLPCPAAVVNLPPRGPTIDGVSPSRSKRLVLLLSIALAAIPAAASDPGLAELPPLASGALRVHLVRHGQALSNLEPKPQLPPEQLDALTATGRKQAERVGRALAGRRIAEVVSSPAMRAQQTAATITRVLGLTQPLVEPRLRPQEKGEPDAAVGERVHELARALARSRRGREVVLVAHGEVLRAYLARIGAPVPAGGLDNGTLTIVDVAATGAESVRLTNHAPAVP